MWGQPPSAVRSSEARPGFRREAANLPASRFVLMFFENLANRGVLAHNDSKGDLVKTAIEAINQMQADGVIGKYAIGGAVGATLYLEPAATIDLDIFVVLPTAVGGLLTLTPIYEYLKSRGAKVVDEYIEIDGWAVQFLPPSNDLETEAVAEAVSTTVEGVRTWVMSAEHLVAIALRTGRSKDHIRLLQFIEREAVNRTKLQSLIEKHGLTLKWKQFESKYLEGADE